MGSAYSSCKIVKKAGDFQHAIKPSFPLAPCTQSPHCSDHHNQHNCMQIMLFVIVHVPWLVVVEIRVVFQQFPGDPIVIGVVKQHSFPGLVGSFAGTQH